MGRDLSLARSVGRAAEPVVEGARGGANAGACACAVADSGGRGLSIGRQGRRGHRVLGRGGQRDHVGIRRLHASIVSIEVVGVYSSRGSSRRNCSVVGEGMVDGADSIAGGKGLQVCRGIRPEVELGRGRKEGAVVGVAVLRLRLRWQWRLLQRRRGRGMRVWMQLLEVVVVVVVVQAH